MADFETITFTHVLSALNPVPGYEELLNGPGLDYELPAEVTNPDQVSYKIADSRNSGMGVTVGGTNQPPADHGVWLTGNPLTSILVWQTGKSGTRDCRITISIVCVLNPTSTSRFWVRRRGQVLVDTLLLSENVAVTGVVDDDKVWTRITGQGTRTTTRTQSHTGYFTSHYTPGNIELTRGHTGAQANVSYEVLELGADWKDVQRLEFTSQDIGLDSGAHDLWSAGAGENVGNLAPITNLGGAAISDLSRAFLDTQYRIDSAANQGNDDLGETIQLTGLDELRMRGATRVNSSLKVHVVQLLEWDGAAGGTPLIAEHIAGFLDPNEEGSEEGDHTRTVTAVAAANVASLEGICSSIDGTGGGSPRGRFDARLISTTEAFETRSEASKSEHRAYSVVQWPTAAPTAPFAAGATRAGAATMGAVEAGAGTLTARGGAAALGSTTGGAGTLTARGGAATLGAVEGGAQ